MVMKENDIKKYDEYSIWGFLERECRRQQKPVFFMLTSIEEVIGKKTKRPKRKKKYHFFKQKRSDKVWHVVKPNDDGIVPPGENCISFDKKKIYNLFRDYPHELTDEEKEIFDRENPFWAKFFSGRPRHRVKVRCIADDVDYLTKDKIYEVLEADDGLWEIINDKGEFCYYSPSNFEVVETYNETYCF